MRALVLHPATEQQLLRFQKTPAQAIVLAGPVGIGKVSLAIDLAERILELEPGGFDTYAYGMVIRPEEGKSIGIEAIRQLERFLSLKVPGEKPYDRAAIIENSHLLTTEAQNALLKTLEEPPKGTIVLLTADRVQSLLPTIQSRVQVLTVQRPEAKELNQHFTGLGHEAAEVSRAYAASAGSPGLMMALLEDEDHPLGAAISQARMLLGQTTAERLVSVDKLSKDRALATDTVEVLGRMAEISLQTASGRLAEQWRRVLVASYAASEALAVNAQPKLALTELVLQF